MKHHSNDIRLPKDLSLFPKTLILNHIHFGHFFMKNLRYDFYLGQVCEIFILVFKIRLGGISDTYHSKAY